MTSNGRFRLDVTHTFILAICTEEGQVEIFGFPTAEARDETLEEFLNRFGNSFRFAVADVE